jgi:hypothetical protein
MPNINDIRKAEMEEIIDFYHHIQEYGHIFYGKNSELDEPFKKILEGIEKIREIQKEYWSY